MTIITITGPRLKLCAHTPAVGSVGTLHQLWASFGPHVCTVAGGRGWVQGSWRGALVSPRLAFPVNKSSKKQQPPSSFRWTLCLLRSTWDGFDLRFPHPPQRCGCLFTAPSKILELLLKGRCRPASPHVALKPPAATWDRPQAIDVINIITITESIRLALSTRSVPNAFPCIVSFHDLKSPRGGLSCREGNWGTERFNNPSLRRGDKAQRQ